MPPRLGALLAIVLWGLSFVATKAALRELSPISLVATRFGLGAALLIALLAIRRQPILPPRAEWLSLAGMGFIGVFGHQLLQVNGLRLTSAVHTGWLIGLIPIWSAVLAVILQGERFGVMKAGGLLLGFAGAVLIVTRGGGAGLPSTRGDLLVLASTVTWALYSVVGRGAIERLGAARATAGAMALGWLMLLPLFVVSAGWRELGHVSPGGWGAIAFLGLGCSGLGYLLWYRALEKIETTRVAAFLYIEPLVTLVAAMLLLGETLSPTTAIGGLLVLAGVLVVQRAPASRRAVGPSREEIAAAAPVPQD